MKKKKILIVIAISSLVLVIVAGYFWTAAKPKGISLLKILPAEIDLQVKDVKYEELGGTGVKWEIIADTATYMKKENTALFDKVKIKFIMKDGAVYNLSADRGKIDTASNDMELVGNIVIVSDKGDRFKTELLHFSKKEEQIFTKEPVTMENKFISVKAKGMTLSLKDEHLTLSSSVKAQIQPAR